MVGDYSWLADCTWPNGESNVTESEKDKMKEDCRKDNKLQRKSCEYKCYKKVEALWNYQQAAGIKHCVPFAKGSTQHYCSFNESNYYLNSDGRVNNSDTYKACPQTP